MNKFQILDKDAKALTMAELDKEAAECWGKEVHPKHYANPFPDKVADERASFAERMKIERENAWNNNFNWFDIIGWNIANQGTYTYGWQNVVYTMVTQTLGECLVRLNKDEAIKLAEFVGDTEIHLESSWEKELYSIINYYKPFIDLINHWMAKGYMPVKVEVRQKNKS